METTRYAVVDSCDTKVNEQDDVHEAIRDARERGDCAVVAEHYEYTHSTVEWTPSGEKTWPDKG